MQYPGKSQGFTLIEILIAIAIVGILASIAVPSYSNFLIESRRTDAHIGLRDAGLRLERCRTQSFTYVGCNTSAPTASPEGHYGLAYTAITGTTYTVTATPVAGGPQASDNDCATLVLSQDGLGTATAGTDGDSSNCW